MRTYLEYIKYERSLASFCSERRRDHNEIELERSLLNRVKRLYEAATKRFPNNERLWDQYFMFLCRTKADRTEISNMIDRMLRTQPHNSTTWLKYAKWERNDNKNMTKARNLLTHGIQNHPKCMQLHIEMVNLEMENLKSTNETNKHYVLERLSKIYKAARDAFSNIESCLAVLEEISNFDLTIPLQRNIMKDMMELYCNNELYFETVAQREFEGLITYDKSEGTSAARDRIEYGVSVYMMAVKEVFLFICLKKNF